MAVARQWLSGSEVRPSGAVAWRWRSGWRRVRQQQRACHRRVRWRWAWHWRARDSGAPAAVWQQQCGRSGSVAAAADVWRRLPGSVGVAVSAWQCDSSGGAAEVWHRQRTSGRGGHPPPALRRGGGDRRPTRRAAKGPPPPPGPQGRRRCHVPSPHCATARLGRPVAYPKGRPNPAGPQGRRRRHPSSSCATVSATARRGRRRGPAYPKGRPYCQKRDPAPPEIGRGSKRALTHRAGKSNRRARRRPAGEPPRPGD